jgi:hypothetical protein
MIHGSSSCIDLTEGGKIIMRATNGITFDDAVTFNDEVTAKTTVTMGGNIILPASNSKGIYPASNNYGQIGSPNKNIYQIYATNINASQLYTNDIVLGIHNKKHIKFGDMAYIDYNTDTDYRLEIASSSCMVIYNTVKDNNIVLKDNGSIHISVPTNNTIRLQSSPTGDCGSLEIHNQNATLHLNNFTMTTPYGVIDGSFSDEDPYLLSLYSNVTRNRVTDSSACSQRRVRMRGDFIYRSDDTKITVQYEGGTIYLLSNHYKEGSSYNTSSGTFSHAEGSNTTASGFYSHAEGCNTTAGSYSHAEGYYTTASGSYSHAEGYYTTAPYASHAEGYYTTVSGSYSHAEGYYTTAPGSYQHIQGKFNTSDASSAHIVGGGTSSVSRKNIHTLDWSGNGWFAGDVTTNTHKLNSSLQLYAEAYDISTTAQTFTLGVGKTYLLMVYARTESTNAVYGMSARMIATPDSSSSTANVTILAMGTTSNTGFTITAGNFQVSVKASSSTYEVDCVLYETSGD